MAVLFEKLTYKNFLSTGAVGTTVQLNKSATTLIQGASGAGKSTIIDALTFGLYGKPFRDINKPVLVNSINQKALLVEVEFSVDGKHYRVVRGIKPNKFEIYVAGVLLNQDAAVKDYQKVLEDQILKMTFKTFTQIVILGSTAYTPFMQLGSPARREVIEDILDIGIFSTMNVLLKKEIQLTKEEQQEVDVTLRENKVKTEAAIKLIRVLEDKAKQEADVIAGQLTEVNDKIASLKKDAVNLATRREELKGQRDPMSDLDSVLYQIKIDASTAKELIGMKSKTLAFFQKHDNCPTCKQEIAIDHKTKMVQDLSSELNTDQQTLAEKQEEREALEVRLQREEKILEQIEEINSKIRNIQSSVTILLDQKRNLTNLLNDKTDTSQEVQSAKTEVDELCNASLVLSERKKELAKKRELQDAIAVLLKDNGVKTAIIREYLPIINRSINKFLEELDLFVGFHLDENFNEQIKSRHRDDFTYNSFSEGEKLRIDIAILLTWRYIASLKNSCSTNLLIIDEILVGRLDPTNTDIVLGLIDGISRKGTHVFAIAHQDSLQDKFRSLIRFEKKNDFSVMI